MLIRKENVQILKCEIVLDKEKLKVNKLQKEDEIV